MSDTFSKEERCQVMRAVRTLTLGGSLGRVPYVSVKRGKVGIKALGKDSTVRDGPIGPVNARVLRVALVEKNTEDNIEIITGR